MPDNLTCIVDRNRLMMDGFTEELMSLEPLADRWRSFGWSCREVDGHSIPDLLAALRQVPWEQEHPSVLIANTVKGRGIPFVENDPLWHYRPMTDEEYKEAKMALNGEGV